MGEFLINNLALVALFLASGVMLVWPELSKLAGGGAAALGTLEATRLMNQSQHAGARRPRRQGFRRRPPAARAPHPAGRAARSASARSSKFKDKPVLVTCRNGNRAGAAARVLKKLGFTNVFQLKGGLPAWEQASLPVETLRWRRS